MKFRALRHTDAGRYGCCIQVENGTEQCRNITLMVYSTDAHADYLQDVTAAHVHGVTEQREDLPTSGDSYNYEIDPVRKLNDADIMLRGGKLVIFDTVHRLQVHSVTQDLKKFRKLSLLFSSSFLLSRTRFRYLNISISSWIYWVFGHGPRHVFYTTLENTILEYMTMDKVQEPNNSGCYT
jgi:hypothetical protein